jgi:hypothetical protein
MNEKETAALKEAIFTNMAQILGLDAKKGMIMCREEERRINLNENRITCD